MKILVLALVVFAFQRAQAVEYPIKNFLQIPYSLESATGISQKIPEFVMFYNNHKSKLPQKGELNEITVPGVLTQLSYGSLFCQELVTSDSKFSPAGRWVHRQIDFTRKASEWSDANLVSLFSEYAEIFWQRSLEQEEVKILLEEGRSLWSAFPDQASSNLIYLTTLCSVFAGSFSFLVL